MPQRYTLVLAAALRRATAAAASAAKLRGKHQRQ